MKKIIKIKRGELTTQQIVGLIILITSFAVILFFFFRLNLGETTNKEICHNSVIMKGKSIASKFTSGPLDCKTSYLCITGGGECEGINPTVTKKVKPDNKNEIMKVIADEMADCWRMFGEGKISYLDWKDFTGAHCAICSIIKFDKNIKEIKYEEFYDYLSNNKKDNSQTYLNYFYGNFKNINDWESFQDKNLNSGVSIIDSSKKYSIATGINKGNWRNIGEAHLPVYLVESDQIASKTYCKVFDITKA